MLHKNHALKKPNRKLHTLPHGLFDSLFVRLFVPTCNLLVEHVFKTSSGVGLKEVARSVSRLVHVGLRGFYTCSELDVLLGELTVRKQIYKQKLIYL